MHVFGNLASLLKPKTCYTKNWEENSHTCPLLLGFGVGLISQLPIFVRLALSLLAVGLVCLGLPSL